jgi:hypothetical protein
VKEIDKRTLLTNRYPAALSFIIMFLGAAAFEQPQQGGGDGAEIAAALGGTYEQGLTGPPPIVYVGNRPKGRACRKDNQCKSNSCTKGRCD